jgi:hypothetical protein
MYFVYLHKNRTMKPEKKDANGCWKGRTVLLRSLEITRTLEKQNMELGSFYAGN